MAKGFNFDFEASGNVVGEFGNLHGRMYDVVPVIPDDFASHVGQIIARWSCQEWLLRRILDLLVTADDPKRGRIAIAMPSRSEQVVERVEQLMAVANLSTTVNLGALKGRLKESQRDRNMIAHSVWMRDGNKVFVQHIRGNWPQSGKTKRSGRAISPEAVAISDDKLQSLVRKIEESIKLTMTLRKEIESALRP